MEYYAKSNDTKKEVKNVNDIRNILIYLLDSQMDKLNENESKMIISYLDSLKQQTVQEQKTLREHEKDIVTVQENSLRFLICILQKRKRIWF